MLKENEIYILATILSLMSIAYYGLLLSFLFALCAICIYFAYIYRSYIYDKIMQVQYTSVPVEIEDKQIQLQDDIYVSLPDIHSMGISGMTGSGKTTYVTYLCEQVKEYPIIVCDIHYPDKQSLGKRLENKGIPIKIIDNVIDIKAYLLDVSNKLVNGETLDQLIVIDEYTSLLRQDKQIFNYVLDISQQGRKFNAFIWLIAQSWKAKDVGGSEIRNGLVSFSALRQRKDDSRLAVGYAIDGISSFMYGQVHTIVFNKGIDKSGFFTP